MPLLELGRLRLGSAEADDELHRGVGLAAHGCLDKRLEVGVGTRRVERLADRDERAGLGVSIHPRLGPC